MNGNISKKVVPIWRADSRQLKVGGLTRFSSCDYPGQLAAVVFIQGCPWRCGYCHNPHLQSRGAAGGGVGGAAGGGSGSVPFAQILDWLPRRVGLLDAVVFSGGEACIDPALPEALQAVRALGFKTGLHTAGIYPARLQQVLPLLDWVGLDIKAPLAGQDGGAADVYTRITGVAGSVHPVRQSLAQVLASGVAYECRTTIHPALLSRGALLALAQDLARQGVENYALQGFRAQGCRDAGLLSYVGGGGDDADGGADSPGAGCADAAYPGPVLLQQIGAMFARFDWRE